VVELLPSRIRRRFATGLTPVHMGLVRRMRAAKKKTGACPCSTASGPAPTALRRSVAAGAALSCVRQQPPLRMHA
jgi:hypothetical protein